MSSYQRMSCCSILAIFISSELLMILVAMINMSVVRLYEQVYVELTPSFHPYHFCLYLFSYSGELISVSSITSYNYLAGAAVLLKYYISSIVICDYNLYE